MPELAPRYACPVCLGVKMAKTPVGAKGELVLDHCRRCGGVWFELGEVQRLKQRAPAELWERIARRDEAHRMQCHGCHAPMDRGAEKCPACGWRNRIDCPVCQRPMEPRTHEGLTLDACARCRGVWFDHAELSAVWTLSVAAAAAARGAQPGTGSSAVLASADAGADVLFYSLAYSPDLVYFGARAAGTAVSAGAEALSSAPELALGAAEVAGEAAEGVFGVVLEFLGAIFEAF